MKKDIFRENWIESFMEQYILMDFIETINISDISSLLSAGGVKYTDCTSAPA